MYMYGGKLCVWHSFENEVFVQIVLVHLGVGGGFVDEGNKMGAPKRLQVLPPPLPLDWGVLFWMCHNRLPYMKGYYQM